MKNVLHINAPALAQIKIASCAQEFLGQKGNVKLVAVVTHQVAALKHGYKFRQDSFKSGSIGYVGITNSVNFGHYCRDWNARIYSPSFHGFTAVWLDAQHAELYDAVVHHVHSR